MNFNSMIVPRVSVIMPAFNAELYIEETINSILTQTFHDFEFLIYDDCSSDRTYEIIKSYSDSRIRVFRNEINIGYVKTLNKLIGLASGEYIARQDNDDISLSTRLQEQISFLDKNLKVGLCGSNVQVFGKKNIISSMPLSDEEIRAFMIINNPICHPTVMFRKSIFEEFSISNYDESLCPAEDYNMWFEISKNTQLANLSSVLLKYRWHNENVSQLKKNIQLEMVSRIKAKILFYALSYEISNEELTLFNSLETSEVLSMDELYVLENLLLKLIFLNQSVLYYDDYILRNVFFNFWIRTCKRANEISLRMRLSIMLKSNLFKFKFLFKFLFNRADLKRKLYILQFVYILWLRRKFL